MPQKDGADRLVTPRDIAKIYGVSYDTVRSPLWVKRLPKFIPNSKLRWLSEVDSAIRSWPKYNFGRRFSETDLVEIQKKWDSEWTQSQIAEFYGVSPSTISRVLSGDRYPKSRR